ncbi:MAG: ABC transporter substrate-binding protein, partial [Myxococcaceae bacterium]
QLVDHPSLDAIRLGILEGLTENGFKEGENLTVIFENAQGNSTTAAQIAKKFASLTLDAIVPITTPSTQAIVNQVKKTPIIFAAVSDPLGAKIVSSLQHPGHNVTGVADIPPVEQQLNFLLSCLPDIKKLGVIYNPGEANAVAFLEKLKPLAKEKNIEIITAAAPKSVNVSEAAQSLVNNVEAFFIGNDNTVVSGLEALVKTCLEAKKPLFMSDPDSVERGALAAYAYDQRQIGKQVGSMVAKVLKGNNPGEMAVEIPTELKLTINPHTAEKLKVTCEQAVALEEK